jgi:hypothetical protein
LKEKETNNVGEVRRKVQEMTWKEGQKPLAEGEQNEGAAPSPVKALKGGNEEVEEKKTEHVEEEGGKDLKRKSIDRNESSILEPLSPKRIKETPSVCPLSDQVACERKELIGSHHPRLRNPHQSQR